MKNFSQFNEDVFFKKSGGKTIFQPRIECWYDDRAFRHEELPAGYEGMSRIELYEKLEVSARLYEFNACLEAKLPDDCEVVRKEIDDMHFEISIKTHLGTVNTVIASNKSNAGQVPCKWWIENKKDLEIWAYIEENKEYSFNMDTFNRINTEMGHLGMPTMFLPRTSMQKLIVEDSGVENTYYLLADYPDEVEAFFKSLSKGQKKMVEVAAQCPIKVINYGDNLHCNILPPYLFEKYVLPEYEMRSDILHKAGKFVHSHWDGDVKGLLPYAKTCHLDGIEAITPLPQGDVTVEEVKAALGDQVFLVDGLAAVLFSDTHPLEELKNQTQKVLELFAGQLVLGISDEFPSDGNLDRILMVRDMVEDFNAKL